MVRDRNSSYRGKVLGRFQFAFYKSFVNDRLRGDVGQFTFLPGFDLLSHRLEVPWHSINAHRDAVDERERLLSVSLALA